jgi:CheY-like chemotaxis protein
METGTGRENEVEEGHGTHRCRRGISCQTNIVAEYPASYKPGSSPLAIRHNVCLSFLRWRGRDAAPVITTERTARRILVAINPITDSHPQHALRVLLVDDNHDAADSLSVLLRLWGYDCRVSYDGVSALHLARVYRPDCVLLDINMPKMDGYAVARRLREQPDLAAVKLVAVTAYSDKMHARRIRETGFDHHIIKPADTDELERLLAKMDEGLRLTSRTKNRALAAVT